MIAILSVQAAMVTILVAAAARSGRETYLRRLAGILITVLILFGGLLVEVGPVLTNFGNVWFSGIVASHLLLLHVHGRAEFRLALRLSTETYAVIAMIVMPLALLPDGPEPMTHAVHRIASVSPVLVVASYSAFLLGMLTAKLVYVRSRWRFPSAPALAAAAIAGQAVDSLVFFPVLLFDSDVARVAWGTASGLALKIPLTLAIVAIGAVLAVSRVVDKCPVGETSQCPIRPPRGCSGCGDSGRPGLAAGMTRPRSV